jgi:hypothetical protein
VKQGYEVAVRPAAKEDLRKLPFAVQVEAVKYILRLEKSAPTLGLPLEHFHDVGDLSDCRKIYIDDRRHRVVYRVLPDEKNPKSADVIAVGPRKLKQVYVEAVKRLGREPEKPQAK